MKTIESVNKHIKNAWIASCVSGGLTLAIALASYGRGKAIGVIDEWSIIDGFLIFALAFGIYKKSRFCATFMLIYFIISKTIAIISSDGFIGVPLGILFAYFFFKGVQAAFLYHSRFKEKQENKKRSKIVALIGLLIGGFTIFIFSLLMILGSISPETYIYTADQLPEKYANKARELELIDSNERIRFFYTDAIFDIEEGMYFVTNTKLVIYTNYWEEPASIIKLSEIKTITPSYDDSFMNDSSISIETSSGLEFEFPLSSEKGRDREFVQHIKNMMIVEQSSGSNS